MAMQTEQCKEGFKLVVPLDASRIKDFKPERPVKVIARRRDGKTEEQTVNFTKDGKGNATFTFAEQPGRLRVVVGPGDASAEELLGLQTIGLDLSARQWEDRSELTLPPIRISDYYWHWWLRWCRTFTIRGKVVCPDGSPVPGATVCAYDVDWWWWWSSLQLVGCDVTDATGAFEVTFRWCCGWWPWWWWKYRTWQLELALAERIVPVLQRDPKLLRLPAPSPKPTITIFEQLLAEDGVLARKPATDVDPAALVDLRERLLKRLPSVPELERLRIWPWWPWFPWWDCAPDIIFKVTQDCPQPGTIIVDEGFGDVRWNIPTTLDVTLTASEKACCIPVCHDPRECPEGKCVVLSRACDDLIDNIGGNPGAPAAPAGYANPGLAASNGDRPYAGAVRIHGVFGDMAGVDYYEFEWAPAAAGPWSPMPVAAAGGFTRSFWGPALPAGAVGVHPVPFNFALIGGQNVIESREHFEANNALASWGTTRFWIANTDLLMVWLTENNFADGTYYLRLKGWDLVGGNLVNSRILPLCDTDKDNYLVLTSDNRVVGPGSGHVPSATPDHPCGPGTVHLCTLEPDTDFTSVKVIAADGTEIPLPACANVDVLQKGGTLEIDFMAHDPDGHLAYYTLTANYGENLFVDLLAVGALSPGPAGPVPPAAQVGPTYGNALAQGAVAPVWNGGMIHLSVPLSKAFPEPCCYQLELIAHKRTIVNCDYSLWGHANRSEFTFGVM